VLGGVLLGRSGSEGFKKNEEAPGGAAVGGLGLRKKRRGSWRAAGRGLGALTWRAPSGPKKTKRLLEGLQLGSGGLRLYCASWRSCEMTSADPALVSADPALLHPDGAVKVCREDVLGVFWWMCSGSLRFLGRCSSAGPFGAV